MALYLTILAWSVVLFRGPYPSDATPISLYKSAQLPKSVVMAPRPLMKSEGRGGLTGNIFDDVTNSSVAGVRVLNITFNEKQIGSIEVLYFWSNGSLYQGPRHGSILQPPGVRIDLAENEYIEKVEGKTDGTVVNQLTLTTTGPDYEKKIYGPFGGEGPLSFSLEGFIVGFHGRSGVYLNQIGVYSLGVLKRSEAFGGSGGDLFDEHTDTKTPPIVGVSKLFIGHGDRIDSIQAEYLLLGNVTWLGERHGGTKGNATAVTFDQGEVITAVELETDKEIVSRLTLVTEKQGGVPARYGPFGKLGTTPHSLKGNILGFHGKAGLYMDSLGFYYI